MTLEQKIAEQATKSVQAAVSKELGKEYRNACEGLPVLLLQSGLLPTLAWLQSASQKGWKQVGDDLIDHLIRLDVGKNKTDVLTRLRGADTSVYQVYFELTLKAAVWQKRIAKALMTKDNDYGNKAVGSEARHAGA